MSERSRSERDPAASDNARLRGRRQPEREADRFEPGREAEAGLETPDPLEQALGNRGLLRATGEPLQDEVDLDRPEDDEQPVEEPGPPVQQARVPAAPHRPPARAPRNRGADDRANRPAPASTHRDARATPARADAAPAVSPAATGNKRPEQARVSDRQRRSPDHTGNTARREEAPQPSTPRPEALPRAESAGRVRPESTPLRPAPDGGIERGRAERPDGRSAPEGPRHLVANDRQERHQGQMSQRDFLDALEWRVSQRAEQALKPTPYSAEGCPWIAFWFSYYRARDVSRLERSIHRFAPETRRAATAEEYLPLLTERVGRAVERWAQTRQVDLPPGMPGPVQEAARHPEAHPPAESNGSGPELPAASNSDVESRLGSGRPLDANLRHRMESALGSDFRDVRVHTESAGASFAAEQDARAVALSDHIAFADGEYRPGTPVGDALIAHELAHVAQQEQDERPAAEMLDSQPIQDRSLEAEADRSALGAVGALWSRGRKLAGELFERTVPRLRSGVGLQRCGSSRFPSYRQIVADVAVQTATDAAWQSTEAAANAAGRREEGFWIRLNTSNSQYSFTNHFTGPTVGPGTGASAAPGAKPADTASPSGGTYTVGLFHTHTPTAFRPVGRGVGPSGADENFHNSNDVVGVVYDYRASPPGSGNIPAGHPIGSPAKRYHSGPNRRQNP